MYLVWFLAYIVYSGIGYAYVIEYSRVLWSMHLTCLPTWYGWFLILCWWLPHLCYVMTVLFCRWVRV